MTLELAQRLREHLLRDAAGAPRELARAHRPLARMHSSSIDHLLPMSARMSCEGQARVERIRVSWPWSHRHQKVRTYQSGAVKLTLAPMWNDTEVTRRLKLDAPIVQGPFGSGLSAVDLVVAVSEGGGLGSFGVHHLDGAGIRDVAAQIRARTRRTFALNLWIPLGDSDDPQLTDEQWQRRARAAAAVLRGAARAAAGAAGALRASLRGADRDRARAAPAGVQLRVRRAGGRRARSLPQRRHRDSWAPPPPPPKPNYSRMRAST